MKVILLYSAEKTYGFSFLSLILVEIIIAVSYDFETLHNLLGGFLILSYQCLTNLYFYLFISLILVYFFIIFGTIYMANTEDYKVRKFIRLSIITNFFLFMGYICIIIALVKDFVLPMGVEYSVPPVMFIALIPVIEMMRRKVPIVKYLTGSRVFLFISIPPYLFFDLIHGDVIKTDDGYKIKTFDGEDIND